MFPDDFNCDDSEYDVWGAIGVFRCGKSNGFPTMSGDPIIIIGQFWF